MMNVSATVFTVFSVQITWLHLFIGCGVLLALYIVLGLIREKKPRIRIWAALREAVRTALAKPGDMIRFLVAEIGLLLMCFAHLLFLVSPEEMHLFGLSVPVRYLAFLAVPWWILWALPARINAALAMQDALGGGRVCTSRLLETEHWGRKIRTGLWRNILLPLWAVPMGAVGYQVYRIWKGADNKDGFTALQEFQAFGDGDVKNSIQYAAVILGALILILLIGFAFHSGARHACALGDFRLTDGHHGKLVLGWFVGFILLYLPLWAALLVVIFKWILPLFSDPNGLLAGTVNLPRMKQLLMILGTGILLILPMIPVRSLMVAAMVRQMKNRKEASAS